MAFDQNTRNRLQRFVADARSLLSDEFTRQLQATYGMNPKTGEVADIRSLSGLTPSQQETAHLLRDTLAHYLANTEKGKEKARKAVAIERIVREQAFTVLNRLAALRMSEARGFLIESLAKGYDSKGFQWFHRISGTSLGETGDAYRHYLFSLFDEFSLDLSILFDRFSVQGRLFPSTPVLLKLLALINDEGIAALWAEDETIGWIYQYFNSIEERKKMRAESQAPRNSRELAVRNQFFTPRYVVEFLTDNTLGRIWYEMTQGATELKQICKYLVRRPNEFFLEQRETAPEQEENLDLSQEELLQQAVYIEHRTLKDPRDIRMLDPACGSMHFGLYAFDLFETIYSEAWDIETAQGTEAFIREHGRKLITSEYKDKADFLIDVPRLIIENNIHGVDIDPRATQIAGLSLWLRAHNSWQQADIKPQFRPKIQRSNIVCAEPMPGEKALLQEFTASLKPTVLGQLVELIFEKMELAGEAGTLLKIELEIQDAIAEAKQVWQKQNQALNQFPDLAKIARQRGEIDFDVSDINDEGFWEQAEQKILDALSDYAQSATTDKSGQRRLFAEDAAKGFAFIELCRKRFDVVLMNPPFGEFSEKYKSVASKTFVAGSHDIIAGFIERMSLLKETTGLIGCISSRAVFYGPTNAEWREKVVIPSGLPLWVELGEGVLDNAMVETIMYTVGSSVKSKSLFFKKFTGQITCANNLLENGKKFVVDIRDFSLLKGSPFSYWVSNKIFYMNKTLPSLDDMNVKVKVGLQTGDDFRFIRLWSEVPKINPLGGDWFLHAKGGDNSPYFTDIHLVVNWMSRGIEVSAQPSVRLNMYSGKSEELYLKPGLTFSYRTYRYSPAILPDNTITGVAGMGVFPPINEINFYLGLLNSSMANEFINTRLGHIDSRSLYQSGAISPMPIAIFSDARKDRISSLAQKNFNILKYLYKYSEISREFDVELLCSDLPNKIISEFKVKKIAAFDEILNNYDEIDYIVNCAYFFDDNEYENIHLHKKNFKSAIKNMLDSLDLSVHDILSFYVGQYFGYLSKLKDSTPSHLAIVTSVELKNVILENIKITWGKNESLYLSDLLGEIESLEKYFSSVNLFFEHHLTRYTRSRRQAPIYWPLQTLSGSYTTWMYYHNLTEQTLFTCVNDFVEPKLDSINKDLTTLKNKSSSSKNDEKDFDRLTDLKAELEVFRDELLHIAKFWKPNLNDGVEITAAPLWRLFQHKPWQKKLKETWEQLEEGEYDWAHLAYSIWPARVLRKCHQDRSLAIAHGVEEELWHEVEVIKGRKKEPVWEWQPKPLSEAELNAYIQNKIQA